MRKLLFLLVFFVKTTSFSQDKITRNYLINSKGIEIDLGIGYVDDLQFISFKDGYGVIALENYKFDAPDAEYGILDSNAKWIIDLSDNFSKITTSEGFAVISLKSGTSTLYDLQKRKDMGIIANYISGYSEGLCSICTNGNCETIDKTGKVVFKTNGDKIKPFKNGLSAVYKNDSGIGYIDASGKMIVTVNFPELHDFSKDGFAFFQTKKVIGDKIYSNKENIYGIIDKSGQEILKPSFSRIHISENELTATYKGPSNKFSGYINSQGKKTINPSCDSGDKFINGFATIWNKDAAGIIDATGKIIVKSKYQYATISPNSEIFFLADKTTGLGIYVDKSGTKIIDKEFDNFSGTFNGGYAFVRQNENIDFNSFSLNKAAVNELEKIKAFNDNANNKKREIQNLVDRSQNQDAKNIANHLQDLTSEYLKQAKKYKAIPIKLLHFKIDELKMILRDMANLKSKL